MRENQTLRSSFRAFALTVTGLLACISLGTSQSAHSDSQRNIMSVRISQDPIRRSEDLRDLSRFDILGVSLREGLVEVNVDSREREALKALGFQIEFSPLNSQLNTESPEPYMTPSEVIEQLNTLATTWPTLTELKTIGETRRKRPIMALVISHQPDNQQQPTLLFNAMHHAREVMTTEVLMHMAQSLLQNHDKDPEITQWLQSARIIIVPQVNPDGNQLVHDGQPMWRKNAWESDGRTFGVDINRNYPTLWGACNGSSASKSSDSFRGPASASEPETKAMMNLVMTERPVANISYHSFSEMILYPYGCRAERNPSLELFKSIANDMRSNIIDDRGNKNTYDVGTAPELLYEADGTDADWQFREAGVLSFAMEVNGRMQGFQPAHRKWRDITVQRQEGGWKTLIRRTLSTGVKGHFRGRTAEHLHYKISVNKNGSREDFNAGDQSIRPFRPRSNEGFFYNTLLPGQYVMDIISGQDTIKSITFSVDKNQVTDLGDVTL